MLRGKKEEKVIVLNLKMLKNKGQAIVEFVILLPIIFMILFVVIDFSNVFYQKNHLESVTNDIVKYKENGRSNDYIESKIKEVSVSYSENGDSLKIKVSKKVKLITPLSYIVFDNPFVIETERTILYE